MNALDFERRSAVREQVYSPIEHNITWLNNSCLRMTWKTNKNVWSIRRNITSLCGTFCTLITSDISDAELDIFDIKVTLFKEFCDRAVKPVSEGIETMATVWPLTLVIEALVGCDDNCVDCGDWLLGVCPIVWKLVGVDRLVASSCAVLTLAFGGVAEVPVCVGIVPFWLWLEWTAGWDAFELQTFCWLFACEAWVLVSDSFVPSSVYESALGGMHAVPELKFCL